MTSLDTEARHRALALVVVAAMSLVGVGATAAQEGSVRFQIETVAGTGHQGFGGDGGPASQAELSKPTAVAVDSRGNLFIADFGNHRVRRVDTEGRIGTVVGTGRFQLQDEPVDGTATNLAMPYGISVDSEDRLWVLSRSHHRLLRLDPDGIARVVAGTGRAGFAGDGGPAVDSLLNRPNHLVVGDDGSVYVADSGNHRIRRIAPTGIIDTFAGTGEPGWSGDGGDALSAQIDSPSALALDAEGRVYIADFGNHRVRRVSTDGTIETLVGSGLTAYNGEGLAGRESNIGEPTGVVVGREGNVFVSDQTNNRIRVLTPQGLLFTCAGTGEQGFSGDGGDAREAQISIPDVLAIDGDGDLVFPDYGNHRVRRLLRKR